MKKLFLILGLLTCTVAYAATYTTNYNLYKPGQGDTGWANLVNANFDTIDSQMKSNADATGDADSDSTWTLHNSFPAACSSGEYVSGIGDTLTCSTPAGGGSGDVVGPASSVDDRISTFDGTTGKLIQDSGVSISSVTTNTAKVTESSTAGRSLTLSTYDISADSELYTGQAGRIAFENPTATDDFFFNEINVNQTVVSIYCKTLVGTVDLDVQVGGVDINGSDITCTTTGVLDSSLAGTTDLDVGDELKLAITSVASSPTYLMVVVNATKDD